jgi:broad specificity phosphatase PhoE
VESAILVRHGESAFSVRGAVNGDPVGDCPLTETGREQASRLARGLADEPIDVCITSGFPRTQETAGILLAGRNVPRVVVEELNDPRAGVFEGEAFERYKEWARGHGPLDEPPGGGESRAAIVGRYARGLRRVLERPERSVLVVIHSLPIAYIRAAVEGRDPAAAMGLVPYCEAYRVSERELATAVDRLERWARRPVFV